MHAARTWEYWGWAGGLWVVAAVELLIMIMMSCKVKPCHVTV